MAQLKESELKKQIKEKAFVPLYFLYGEEKYLISHYTEAIVNKAVSYTHLDVYKRQLPGFHFCRWYGI